MEREVADEIRLTDELKNVLDERGVDSLGLLETLRSASYAPVTCLALTCLGLGQIDQALMWLEKGVDLRESNVVLIGVHPAYDDLRGDPRFEKLAARLGLPA